MFDWITHNKEWLFSGAGIAAVVWAFAFFRVAPRLWHIYFGKTTPDFSAQPADIVSKRVATNDATTAAQNAPDTDYPPTLQPKVVFKGPLPFSNEDSRALLQLLPGTPGDDGLPECVRFWKYKIEHTDPDKSFRIGVIAGPSGCGKSSLIEAGILPNLNQTVKPVLVNAAIQT